MSLPIEHALSLQPVLAFAIGGAELVIILLLFAIPAALAVIVLLVVMLTRRGRKTGSPPGKQARLAELDSLLASGTISEAEHAEQRKRILASL